MKKLIVLIFAGVLCLLPVRVLAEANAVVMTPKKCAELTHWLEKNPLDKNARSVRAALMKYTSETPDFSVSPCGELIGKLMTSKNPVAGNLTAQYLFGMGALCCLYPDKKTNEEAKQMAGVQSMVNTYENMKAQNPKIKIRFLEKLVKLKDTYKLQDFVERQTRKCQEN